MHDKRYDNRPKLNYAFTKGAVAGEERITASYKNRRPSRGSCEPRGNASCNSSFRVAGRAGKEFSHRKRDKAEAANLLAASLQALETVGGW